MRKARSWTMEDLSSRSGVDVGTINAIEKRDSRRTQYASAIARAFGVTVEELESGVVSDATPPEPSPPPPEFVPVKRVQLKVSAGVTGFSVEALNGDVPPIFFRHDWMQAKRLRADRLLAVRVNGESMAPGLYDGDLVVINTDEVDPRDGEVFVINYEGEAVIKRLRRDGGQWWLSSDNPDKRLYGDKRCDEHAIIIGRVIYKQSEHI